MHDAPSNVDRQDDILTKPCSLMILYTKMLQKALDLTSSSETLRTDKLTDSRTHLTKFKSSGLTAPYEGTKDQMNPITA